MTSEATQERMRQAAAIAGQESGGGDELLACFAENEYLANPNVLGPAIGAILKATNPARGFELMEPLARKWSVEPVARGQYQRPLVHTLLDCVAGRDDRDPRWANVAIDVSTLTSEPRVYLNTIHSVLKGLELDPEAVERRLALQDPPPYGLLQALSESGDVRARKPLRALLAAATQGHMIVWLAELLADVDLDGCRDELNEAVARTMASRDGEGKLDNDQAESAIALCDRLGKMTPQARFDEAMAALKDAEINNAWAPPKTKTALIGRLATYAPSGSPAAAPVVAVTTPSKSYKFRFYGHRPSYRIGVAGYGAAFPYEIEFRGPLSEKQKQELAALVVLATSDVKKNGERGREPVLFSGRFVLLWFKPRWVGNGLYGLVEDLFLKIHRRVAPIEQVVFANLETLGEYNWDGWTLEQQPVPNPSPPYDPPIHDTLGRGVDEAAQMPVPDPVYEAGVAVACVEADKVVEAADIKKLVAKTKKDALKVKVWKGDTSDISPPASELPVTLSKVPKALSSGSWFVAFAEGSGIASGQKTGLALWGIDPDKGVAKKLGAVKGVLGLVVERDGHLLAKLGPNGNALVEIVGFEKLYKAWMK